MPAQDPASRRVLPPLIRDVQESFNVLFDPSRYLLQTNDCRQVLAFEVVGRLLLPAPGVMSSNSWNGNKLAACHKAEALDVSQITANSTVRSVLVLMEDRGKESGSCMSRRLKRLRCSIALAGREELRMVLSRIYPYTSPFRRMEDLDRHLRDLFRDCPLSGAMISYLTSRLSQKLAQEKRYEYTFKSSRRPTKTSFHRANTTCGSSARSRHRRDAILAMLFKAEMRTIQSLAGSGRPLPRHLSVWACLQDGALVQDQQRVRLPELE